MKGAEHPLGEAGLGLGEAGLRLGEAGLPRRRAGLRGRGAGLPRMEAGLPLRKDGLPLRKPSLLSDEAAYHRKRSRQLPQVAFSPHMQHSPPLKYLAFLLV